MDFYINSLKRGTILNGKYIVEEVLGEGNFGITYKAFHLSLEKYYVIKEYLPSNCALRDFDSNDVNVKGKDNLNIYKLGLNKFLKEAKILASLEHKNIVSVIDFFKENNTAYFVMPYKSGKDLESYLQTLDRDMDEDEIINIAISILEGLAEIHKKNLLHRDVKPANIFLTEDNIPILIDFGASKSIIKDVNNIKNESSTIILTYGYAPPEQYSTQKELQGPWSDIYSLGMVLYQMVTKNDNIPSAQDRSYNKLISNGEDDLKFPKNLKYSNQLINTIKKMVELNPKDRFLNVQDNIKALLEIKKEKDIKDIKDIKKDKRRVSFFRIAFIIIISIITLLTVIFYFVWQDINKLFWEKRFGGAKKDVILSSIELNSGNFISVGYTDSFNSNRDIYFLKVNTQGDKILEKNLDMGGDEVANKVIKVDDNNLIVVGFYRALDTQRKSILLLKVDNTGNILWKNILNREWSSQINDIVISKENFIFAVGSTKSLQGGRDNIKILKMDMEGNIIWSKLTGRESCDDVGKSIIELKDGSIVVAGYSLCFNGFDLNKDLLLVKFDNKGSKLWERRFGGDNWDTGNSIVENRDGSFIIVGNSSSIGNNLEDIYVVKVNKYGDMVWQKSFGGEDIDIAKDILKAEDGGYLIVGYTTSFGDGKEDIYLVKIDKDGNRVWQKSFGGVSSDIGNDILKVKSGGYLISGYTTLSKSSNEDAYLIKVDRNGEIRETTLDDTYPIILNYIKNMINNLYSLYKDYKGGEN